MSQWREFAPLLEGRQADVLQPGIGHCGGILETRKILAWADSYGVLDAPHNVAGPVATAANLHLAAVTPNFLDQVARITLPITYDRRPCGWDTLDVHAGRCPHWP